MIEVPSFVHVGHVDYKNPRIPPLPRTAIEVFKVQDEGTNDVRRLAGIVSGDPSCTQMLLQRANSAYYGLRRTVGDAPHAVSLLGFEQAADLVIALAYLRLGEAFPERASRSLFQQVIRLSLVTAWSARLLTELVRECVEGVPSRATAFSAGMLHPTGRLVFLYNEPARYVALSERVAAHHEPASGDGAARGAAFPSVSGSRGSEGIRPMRLPSSADERAAFDIDHEMLASIVCCAWGLPARLTCALSPCDVRTKFSSREAELLTYIVKAAAAAGASFRWEDEGEPEPPPKQTAATPHAECPGRSVAAGMQPAAEDDVPMAVARLAGACEMLPVDLWAIMNAWEDEVRLFAEHMLST